ncbi:hypothetical protein pSALSNUABM04_045 [Salmonella phage pSal-SNUABM-04]|nr:hypothetical protein pSALSNUABM04_045 [Salmonella phage pSal-SNUABM-04]
MSRRKKQPGFSPREAARERVRSIMRGMNTTESVFLGHSKTHAEKIDREFERINSLMGEDLKAYLAEWLKHSQAAFLGAMQDFKTRLFAVRTDADAKATKLMAVIDNHKWDEIKDVVVVAELELADFDIQVDNVAQETLLSIVEAGAAYEQRRECVRVGLNNNWSHEAILTKLRELDAQAAEEALVAAEAAAAEHVAEQEEPANV